MITNLLLTIIMTPFHDLIEVFPTGSALGVNTAAQALVTQIPALGWVNNYFPLTTAFTVATVLIEWTAIVLATNLALWIYHQFWGNN